MGALAPVAPWIPEDDLVLKNAVEAGASLESLAKGAVQFSRRFTVRELQNRWHALLYDPVISADAAARMIEFERNGLTKSLPFDDVNESELKKRKVDSVRTCYYAMRKRICNEPFNTGEFGFFVSPGDNCFINGTNIPGPDLLLRAPLEDSFEFQDAEFDNLQDVFPEVLDNNCPPCGVLGSSQEFGVGRQHDILIAKNNRLAEVPETVGSSLSVIRDGSKVGKGTASKEPSPLDLCETHDMKANDLPDSVNHTCLAFGRKHVLNSAIPECETTFGQLQYSSPSPAMSDWRTLGPISGVKVPGDSSTRIEDEQTVNPFTSSHDSGSRMTSEFEALLAETELGSHMPANSSNTLLDLARVEDMLFTGDDSKDAIDKIDLDGLSSLLLNSPVEANVDVNADAILDEIPNIMDAKVPVSHELYVHVPSDSSARQPIDYRSHRIGYTPMVATLDPQFVEGHNGVICCTLSTEQGEIPDNDDVIFPPKPLRSPSHRRACNEANHLASSFSVTCNNQATEVSCSAIRSPGAGSQIRGSEMRLKCTSRDQGVESDVSRSEAISNSKHPVIAKGGQGRGALAKKEASKTVVARQPGKKVTEKSAHVSDRPLQNSISVANQGAGVPPMFGNQDVHAQAALADSVFPGPVRELLLDQEEGLYDSDDDIPYFSDIESMVLDMDLGPDDHDSLSNSRVAKYQNEEAKRTIVRLEQAAHSYMQRAIASHGAFAVLYGRYSKHYIKKPEVLLGRATGDVFVDIDLGREGRANKISRRQAILKMDRDGSFHLKNLGKFSLSVNSKEVYPLQSLRLQTNCLIEIRGIAFIFETSQVCVRKYLDKRTGKARARNSKG
ncbi:hypothetical protein Droror1_Dr00001332 [Drosera rotundifolia]